MTVCYIILFTNVIKMYKFVRIYAFVYFLRQTYRHDLKKFWPYIRITHGQLFITTSDIHVDGAASKSY